MLRSDQQLVERMALVFHDWFATSERQGRLVAADDRPVEHVPGAAASARFGPCSRTSPPIRRCCSGSTASRTRRVGPERELRPRGAGALHARRRPRRLHRDRRPRARPLLHRLRLRLVEPSSVRTTSATCRPATTTPTRPSTARPATGPGRTPAGSASRTPLHASFFVLKLWSYFIPQAPSTDTLSALICLYVGEHLRDPPGARGDPDAPGLLRGPSDGEAAGGLPRQPDARDGHLHPRRTVDLAELGRGPAALPPAERRRLGRHALARHQHAARRAGSAPRAFSTTTTSRSGTAATTRPSSPTPRSTRPSRSGTTRRCARSSRTSSSASPTAPSPAASPTWQQIAYRALRQNALRQLIAVGPDLQLS